MQRDSPGRQDRGQAPCGNGKGLSQGKIRQERQCFLRGMPPFGQTCQRSGRFAKTSKALARFNDMLKNREVGKHYWAVVKKAPPEDAMTLRNYLKRNEKQNKSYVYDKPVDGAKEAVLSFRTLAKGDNYRLLGVDLQTGRHHQIRSQLAHIGCPIKGDLKYGAERSNKNGGISLHARQVEFVHPVSKEKITITAPVPQDDKLWKDLEMAAEK